MVKPGDPAPDFTLVAHDERSVSLASLRGAKVLLWFFVEANTPACALEGRGFRDHQSYFDESNIRVVGVSFDSSDDNAAFARGTSSPFRCSVTPTMRWRRLTAPARAPTRGIPIG